MLVLSRRVDEAVRIGDDVDVIVVAINGQQVRLGFRAPRDVRIIRHELLPETTEEPTQEDVE